MSRYSQKQQMRRSFYKRRYRALLDEHSRIALSVLVGRQRLLSAKYYDEPERTRVITSVREIFNRYDIVSQQMKCIARYHLTNHERLAAMLHKKTLHMPAYNL